MSGVMDPRQAIEQAESGAAQPVYVIVGEERFVVDEVVRSVRAAVTGASAVGFND
ncbi:MAG: DNA polymerase III subunit delta, partial [Deltaproteobacteria bacterium]|nr:DNA polymerase III subunit delta [Deltaproteobacteria bacterium]MBW2529910.1 DNA polymerase III subunit delta [Deltaproteobacteria bacterium]